MCCTPRGFVSRCRCLHAAEHATLSLPLSLYRRTQALYNPSVVMLLEQLVAGLDAIGSGRTRVGDSGNGVSQVKAC